MLHIDRAMVREGIENMTEQEMCKVYLPILLYDISFKLKQKK